ncbi:dynamin family protein [Streptomyces sp. NPDC004647]|uniref:dynamin family protein n=1 Tax=Streptomyces sp. NPDC004647 TaxID=3154671 RepID=UPI0033A4EBDA
MPIEDPAQALGFVQEARDAIQRIPGIPEEAADALRAAQRQLNELRSVAAAPVTIGVVGEFSAGKSSVIGAVLGDPRLLPVHKLPATAQVSALELRVDRNVKGPQLGNRAVVEFFGHEHVTACLDYMVGHLAEEVAKADPDCDLKALAAFRHTLATSSTGGAPDWAGHELWTTFDRWARSTLWAREEDNEALRKLVMEIRALSDALALLHPALFGDTYELPTEAVLTVTSRGLPPMPGAPYPHRTPPDEPLTRKALQDDLRRLGTVAPLIRRIGFTVAVPPGTWEPADAGALLLDFPGLGAESSRDAYLCGSQLRNVETILVVGRGDLLGSRDMSRFYGMMQAQGHSKKKLTDAILVTLNKWDTATVPQLPDGATPDGETVQRVSDDLTAALAASRMLIAQRLHRLQVLSVHAAAATRGGGLACTLADLCANSETKAEELLEGQRAWGRLADRMAAVDPEHHWVRDLGEYSRDGGLSSLRRMLARHIDEHGVSLKRQTVRAQASRALRACTVLEARLNARPVAQNSGEAAELQRRFEALRAAADGLLADLNELRNPAKARQGSGGSVLARLEQRAISVVFSWPLWGDLLAAVEDGVVAKSPDRGDWEPPWLANLPEEEQQIYREGMGAAQERDGDTTTAFYAQYATTYRALHADAREKLTVWAEAWLAEHSAAFEDLHAWLEREETGIQLRNLFAHLPGMSPDLRLLQVRLLARKEPLAAIPASVADRFELAPEDAEVPGFPRQRDHVLPWSHEYEDDPLAAVREAESSQYVVARLRRDLVVALSDRVCATFADMLAATLSPMIRTVHSSASAVPDPLQVDQMIRALAAAAGAPRPDTTATEDGRETLRAVLRRWEDAA